MNITAEFRHELASHYTYLSLWQYISVNIMFRTYRYDTQKRRNSIIEISDGSTYSVIGIPEAGNTAHTRFFGKGKKRVFVVKCPKNEGKIDQPNEGYKKIYRSNGNIHSYRHEQEIWNLVYPDNKAYLFTEGGLRLILPCLPGNNLRTSLSDDPLTLCQQILSVAYAVQKFHKLGFNYSDFNLDNVLIEQKSKDLFQAYLIDFDAVVDINKFRFNQELGTLNLLVPDANWETHYKSIDELIYGLISKINALRDERSRLETLYRSFSNLPETDRNILIKRFIEEFNFGKYKTPVYEEVYNKEGLGNFTTLEQFFHFLKNTSPFIYEQLSQTVSNNEAASTPKII